VEGETMTVEEIIDMVEESDVGFSTVRLTPFDEYDPCIIGCWLDQEPNCYRLIYSEQRIMAMLVKVQNMKYLEATEFYDHNIAGAYIGPGTPVYADEVMNHPQETVVTQ
jgi:hypothetical protein